MYRLFIKKRCCLKCLFFVFLVVIWYNGSKSENAYVYKTFAHVYKTIKNIYGIITDIVIV